MAKLRLLFVKEGPSSYISNLDLLRTLQRAFPRTGLEIKHTQGFHPHPIISFPLPLPVGQSSDCELMDFEVAQNDYSENVVDKLNEGMPDGLRILDCYPLVRPASELTYLKTELTLFYDHKILPGSVDVLKNAFCQDEIIIEKRTKHKDYCEINISPLIESISFKEKNGLLEAEAILRAQNPGLNPQYIQKAIEKYAEPVVPDFMRIRRIEILDKDFNVFR